MALELQRIDPWNGDSNTGTTYYGYAKAGAQDSEEIWSITKKDVVDGVLVYSYPFLTGDTSQNTYPAIYTSTQYYPQLSGLRWDYRSGYTYR